MVTNRKPRTSATRRAWTRPDVFTSLEKAVIRGARNYHRLEHLGRRASASLYEETITDLLVSEMAGSAYEVAADCPSCHQYTSCSQWCGSGTVGTPTRMRALTKTQEGGNKRERRHGAHADIVFAFSSYDPDNPREASAATETRLLVQAKRVEPGQLFSPDMTQYRKLVLGAPRYGAVPYYGLYVQQPDAHRSSPTRCRVHKLACDRSIVLVPAQMRTDDPFYLPNRLVDDVLALGWPLRCLGGCRSVSTGRAASVTTAALGFVKAAFPTYEPTGIDTRAPARPALVTVNAAVTKPAGLIGPDRAETAPGTAEAVDETFIIVRLGKQATAAGEERGWIGYSPDMTDDQLREAARMYWRCDPERAARRRYLVVAHERRALRAYRISQDGVTATTSSAGRRRVAFDLEEIPVPAQRGLLERADRALAALGRGASNPIHYVEH